MHSNKSRPCRWKKTIKFVFTWIKVSTCKQFIIFRFFFGIKNDLICKLLIHWKRIFCFVLFCMLINKDLNFCIGSIITLFLNDLICNLLLCGKHVNFKIQWIIINFMCKWFNYWKYIFCTQVKNDSLFHPLDKNPYVFKQIKTS